MTDERKQQVKFSVAWVALFVTVAIHSLGVVIYFTRLAADVDYMSRDLAKLEERVEKLEEK